MVGSQTSPAIGYVLAISAMAMIIIAMHMESIWPTRRRTENALVFSLFWGLMLGAVGPFLAKTFLEGGASAIFEMLSTPP